MTRNWPDMRDGTTICHLSDQHFGQRTFSSAWAQTVGTDLDALADTVSGYVNTGDCDHWRTTTVDGEILSWMDAREAAAGVPMLVTAGNHDLSAFGGTDPHPGRTSTQWAQDIGVVAPNRVVDMGDLRIIGTSPDVWQYTDAGNFGRMAMTTATLEWLDGQVAAAGSRHVFIANHAPVPEHFPGHMVTETAAALADIIGGAPNVMGWLSGHRHANIRTEPDHVKVVNVGGRNIFAVNAPPAGGSMPGTLPDRDIHQFGTTAESIYLTYRNGTLTARWRDHLRGRWTRAAGDIAEQTLTI